jgi:hypothetical protein
MEVNAQVLNVLTAKGGWASAADICSAFPGGTEKITINRTLYALKHQGLVEYLDEKPPRWRVPPKSCSAPLAAAIKVHCVVDLGNTHDCLKNLEPYASTGALTVSAYADLAFAGYGVVPPLAARNIEVFHSDTPDKNSADVQIIWDVCRLVEQWKALEPQQAFHIFVATKDLGFLRLKALVERYPLHKLTFVTGWDTLRLHIE